jgi:hypothetical protein
MTNLMAILLGKSGLGVRLETLKNMVKNRLELFYTDGRRKNRGAHGWR